MSDGTLMTPPADASAPADPPAGDGASPAATPPVSEGQGNGAPEQAASEGGNDTQTGGEGGDTQTGGEGAETSNGETGEDSVAGAPESYDAFDVPEGVQLDDALLDDFSATARELNLPQEAAQRVLNLGFKLLESAAQQHVQALNDARVAWADQTRADPEIGGDKLQENLAVAIKARDTFASPALVTLLNDSGLGSHPEVVRLFARVGAAISEDKLVTGADAPAKPTGLAAMYPTMSVTQ